MKFIYYSLIFCALNATSQVKSYSTIETSSGRLMYTPAFGGAELADGSPYMNSTYLPSKVSNYSGTTPLIRYNAEKDEMEFLKDEKKYYLTKSDSLEVKIAEKLYKYLSYNGDSGIEKGFFVVLLNNKKDKFSLFKKESITLIPKSEPKSSYDKPSPAYYRVNDEKFYLELSEKIIEMPKKKKDFILLFPNNIDEVEVFIKENKTSFKNEKKLIELISFVNTIEKL
ncbi:hypothetical protein [Flavobacterium sp.]|uniref:hypothetical protein n=1 Tax=Flavobacterium sp. TaxID=239 RepID=UPI003751EE53